MKRLLRLIILPTLFTAVLSALLGLAAFQVWEAVSRARATLAESLQRRAIESLEYFNRTIATVSEQVAWVILAAVVCVILGAALWYFTCWSKKVAGVGEAAKRVWVWWACMSASLLIFAAAASFIAWRGRLFQMMNPEALLMQGLLSLLFFPIAYWLATWLFTPTLYRQGAPLGGLRPW